MTKPVYKYFRQTLSVVVFLLFSGEIFAYGAPPSQPNIIDSKFPPLLKRAAYAAFLGDACSVSNKLVSTIQDFVAAIANDSLQKELQESFNTLKAKHSRDSNPIGVAKRCYLESGKTKSFISDVDAEVASYARAARKKLDDYQLALRTWEQAKAEEEARSRQQEQEKNRATAEKTANQLGRLIVGAKYDGGSNIGVQLTGYEYRPYDSTYTMKVEIRWNGKFSGKSYGADGVITAKFDSSTTWELGSNFFWNPSYLSASLQNYISCYKTLFGSCD